MQSTVWPARAGRLARWGLPVLLAMSACNPDSQNPVSPTDAAVSAEASRLGCSGHERDCRSAANGRIAYSRWVDNTGMAIFSAKADGSDVLQLTTPQLGVFGDVAPDWSPNGSTLLFERDFAGLSQQLYRVNADGGGLTQLFDCAGRCLGVSDPVYSPDGKTIAFDEANGDDSYVSVGIWFMNPDGSNQRQITNRRFPSTSEDHMATFSPDGRQMAFTRSYYNAQPAAKQAVFVCNVDGSDLRRITPWQLNGGAADWSPDGRTILFSAHYDIGQDGTEQLFTVRPDGSGVRQLTPIGLAEPSNIEGKFSPDGRKIIFTHRAPNPTDPIPFSLTYTMNADGSNVVLVAFADDWYQQPAWGTHP